MIFWSKVVVPSLNILGLLGSLTGLAIAAGLLLNTRATLDRLSRLNRWFSSRRAIKPLEMPRKMERDMTKSLRWYGAAFVVGGAYSAFAILQVPGPATMVALGIQKTLLASILVDTVRWVLIVGGTVSAILGLVVLLAPGSWHAMEARANRWYSTRQALAGADTMRLTLDGWVERNPRPSAMVLGIASAIAAAAYAYLLLR